MDLMASLMAVVDTSSIAWLWGVIGTLATTLSSVIAFLYKAQIAMKDTEIASALQREAKLEAELASTKTENKEVLYKLEQEIKECEAHRRTMAEDLAGLKVRVEFLEKREKLSTDHEGTTDRRLDDLERKP